VIDATADPPGRVALIAIAGSAGAILPMRQLLSRLPADFPVPILYLQHLSGSRNSSLPEVLQYGTGLEVRWARDGERPKARTVHVCPAGSSFVMGGGGRITIASLKTSSDVLRSADLFFASVAAHHGPRAVAIVLSGYGSDGREGICAVHAEGGAVFTQDEDTAEVRGMPRAAGTTGVVDFALSAPDLAPLLVELVRHGKAAAALEVRAMLLERSAPHPPSPLRDRLQDLLARAVAYERADLGNLQLLDRFGVLSIVAQRGFGLGFLSHFRGVRADDDSACGRALRDRTSVFLADVDRDPLFAPHRRIAAVAGFRAVRSTPLIGRGGHLIGVLSVHFRRPLPPAASRPLSLAWQERFTAATFERLVAP
jgi:hypothetical protein